MTAVAHERKHRITWRGAPGSPRWRFTGDPVGMLCLAIVLLILLAAICAPLLTGYAAQGLGDPNPIEKLQPPSTAHWLGTDHLGRDLWARILFGARTSLSIAATVVILSIVIGVPLGILAAYFGGWIDEGIMRVTDVFLAFPPLLLAILIAAAMGPGLLNCAVAIALSWWPWYARIARAQGLSLRHQPFVEAAQVIGVRDLAIMLRHILPGVLTPVLVQATLDFGSAILTESALAFLGLGAVPPTPDWGALVSSGRIYFPDRWWYVVFSGLAIFMTTLSFTLIGDSLRDAFDTKRRS